MSTTVDILNFNLEQQRAEIDRAQAEIRKFVAEQNKLADERLKLEAEAAKLGRDRWLAPVAVLFSGVAAVGGSVAAILSLFRLGAHP